MLFSRPFSHYLWAVLSLLAVGFFSSGAISWIAANWSLFSKTEKFGLVEGFFLLSLLIGVGVYLREIRRTQPPFQSAIWLFLSAVLIGGLFALIGQVYQTGADTWQLFAIWAALQVPLLWALPNVANGLLWLVTFNTAAALALVLNGQSLTELLWAVALNLPLFFLAERFAETFRDRWRILAHLLLAWLFFLFVLGGLLEAMSRVAFWAMAAGLVWHYRRYYTFLILGFAYAVVEGNLVIIDSLEYADYSVHILLMLIFNLSALAFAIKHLHQRRTRLGSALLVFLVALVAISFLLFCFIALRIESEHTLVFFVVVSFGIAFQLANPLARSAAFAVSAAFGVVYFLLLNDDYADVNGADIVLLGLLAMFAFIYYRDRSLWLRVLLTLAGLFVLVLRYLPFILGVYRSGEPLQIALSVYALLPLLCLFLFTRQASAAHAAAWGMLLFLLGTEGVQAVNFSDFSANAETELRSFPEFLHAITVGVFTPEQITLTWCIALLSAFAPLWLSLWLMVQRKVQGITAGVLLLASVLISIGFVSGSLVGLLLSLLLMAHISQSRSLFVVGVVGLLIFLTQFYYNLTISLLFKSFLLMGEAVLLGVLAFSVRKNQEKSADATGSNVRKTVPIAAAISLMTTLGLANFSIWQFEDILENGEKIVLKLVPVDPRSLMQGDYMVLNYDILTQIDDLPFDSSAEKQQLRYLRLKTAQGVDEACGELLSAVPTEFSGCRANVYLPMKIQYAQIKMAGQDFFFPEGKREHFEQAKYGEFRFKDGKLLLLRLLDEKLNAL